MFIMFLIVFTLCYNNFHKLSVRKLWRGEARSTDTAMITIMY